MSEPTPEHFWQARRTNPALPIVVGLVGLTALSGLQLGPNRNRIEHQLAADAKQALAEAGLGQVAVSFDGRDARLGAAGSDQLAARADQIVSRQPGVRRVTGPRPRTAPLAAGTQRPSGPAATGPAATRTATPSLTPETPAGTSPTPAASVPTALQTTPATAGTTAPTSAASTASTSASSPTTQPPEFGLELTANRVVVRGVLPSAQSGQQVVRVLRQELPDRIVVTDLRVSPGVPDLDTATLDRLLAALTPDSTASLRWAPGPGSLQASVPDELIAARVRTLAAAAGFGRIEVEVGAEALVRSRIRATPKVTFRISSAALGPQARERFRELAQLLVRHPEVSVLITGHTDNSGDADFNLELSRQRAESVAEALIALGVRPEQIQTDGLGATHPAKPNNSVANRAANRRAEISVVS